MAFESDSIYSSSKAEKEKQERLLQRERFLNLRHFPARMLQEEVAELFRMSTHDIPILVAHGLLKPLGNPIQSSVKYFPTAVLMELAVNIEWLNKATATIQGHWAMKNARKSANAEFSPLPEKARASSRRSAVARTSAK